MNTLTISASTIIADARKLAKEKIVRRVWTNTGHVVVKLLNDRLKTISSLSDLDLLVHAVTVPATPLSYIVLKLVMN